jgi:hypothetical protein
VYLLERKTLRDEMKAIEKKGKFVAVEDYQMSFG